MKKMSMAAANHCTLSSVSGGKSVSCLQNQFCFFKEMATLNYQNKFFRGKRR